jgi:multiple sugar transport system permease protein
MQYEGLVCNYLEFLWGAGGEVIGRDRRVLLDSSASVSALALMRRMIAAGWAPRGVLSFQEQQALEFFEQGKALMMRNWPYAWTLLQRGPLAGRVGMAPLIHAPGREPAGTLGGWGLGIARGAADPQAAWEFIEFATSPEAQEILHFSKGAVPTRRALFEDGPVLARSPHFRELYPALLRARPRPPHPDYPRISAIMQKHVSAVLAGIETPREAAGAMARSVQDVLSGENRAWPARLLHDPDLGRTVKNTVVFTALSVPCELLLGMLFALLLNRPSRGRSLSRLSVLIPWALPTAVMAMAWQWMFNNPFGVINDLVVRIGLAEAPPDWLSSPAGAMLCAVFADVWKTTPFVAIILLAGLQSVPAELKEGLSIDGAGGFAMFVHLVLPWLMPFIRVALVFRIIHAAGIFDLVWVLTRGGPADATRTLSLYIYDLGFRYGEMGYALFLTAVFLGALVAISLLVVRLATLGHERAA